MNTAEGLIGLFYVLLDIVYTLRYYIVGGIVIIFIIFMVIALLKGENKK